ncbi:E3 ubiquitin-protein ligase RAD18 [Melanerpes formicivorus]|uniref:E3 ubiquitin-protein ligase RAD18 n=1 Tax=Melanerpes formicivorus TaxID=211600 RepID=UPI00358EEAF6
MALPVPEPPWPQSLSRLKDLEDLLRCGICFDYFSIAVIIPQCSHNYCSLCIRKFLSYKAQCPTCSVAASESDLRSNRTLDELVKSFQSARQQLLLVLPSPLTPSPACSRPAAGSSPLGSAAAQAAAEQEVPVAASLVKKEEACTPSEAGQPAGHLAAAGQPEAQHSLGSSSAELHSTAAGEASPGSPESTPGQEQPSTSVLKAVRKVECPVCEVPVPEQYINRHLDSCLGREEKKDSLRSSALRRKPLCKVVYNLLSERELRRRLRALGLSARGSRQQLERRHQEFTLLYNAEGDSLQPRPAAELIRELESRERLREQLERSRRSARSLSFSKEQTEQEIDELQAEYRSQHRRQFQLLVEQVSQRWKRGGKRRAEGAPGTAEAAPGTAGGTARELPAATGPREEPQAASGPAGAQSLQAEPAGSSSAPGPLGGRQSPASPEPSPSSGSTSSSCSDILREPPEPEPCSASPGSSVLALGGHKVRSAQPHLPKGKRKRKRS